MNEERNDLQKMITQALEEIKEAEGEDRVKQLSVGKGETFYVKDVIAT